MTAPCVSSPLTEGSGGDSAPLLEATDLSRRFGSAMAVRSVSLVLRPGDRVALLGPNGAGKTTLIRMLATALRPTAGALSIGGVNAARSPSLARENVGLVGHQTFLYGDLSVRENLRFYGRLYTVSALTQRIDEVLALVALRPHADRPVRVLSRGMQQRASLARALLHNPRVLLLDEPETGLDDAAQTTLANLLRQWSDQHRAVLFASHRLDWMQSLAERAIILQNGVIVEDLNLRSVTDLPTRYRSVIGSP